MEAVVRSDIRHCFQMIWLSCIWVIRKNRNYFSINVHSLNHFTHLGFSNLHLTQCVLFLVQSPVLLTDECHVSNKNWMARIKNMNWWKLRRNNTFIPDPRTTTLLSNLGEAEETPPPLGMAGKSGTTPATYSPSLTTGKKKPLLLKEEDWTRPDGRGFHQCRPACKLHHSFISMLIHTLIIYHYYSSVPSFYMYHKILLISEFWHRNKNNTVSIRLIAWILMCSWMIT